MIRRTLWIVFSVHFALVFILCVHHFFWKEKPKTKIIVRTIPQKTIVATAEKPKAVSPKPKAAPVKQTVNKPITAPGKQAMKAQAQTSPSVAKTKPVEIVKSKGQELPVPILRITPEEVRLPSEIITSAEEEKPSYGQTLIAYLQGCLDLPEFGEVKVHLEISRNGQLVRFEILEEKSKKNSDFLKNRLPELAFPCFNDSSHETAVFTITFKNSTRPVR